MSESHHEQQTIEQHRRAGPRGAPQPLPRGLLVPVHRTQSAPANDTPRWPGPDPSFPTLEELVQEKRRAFKRAAIRLTVRIVLVEIWLASFIGTMVTVHSQPPGQAFTSITHPWMWWTVPATFPVLFAGTIMIIQRCGSCSLLQRSYSGDLITTRPRSAATTSVTRYALGSGALPPRPGRVGGLQEGHGWFEPAQRMRVPEIPYTEPHAPPPVAGRNSRARVICAQFVPDDLHS
ncbi:hypothetical protein, partial [Pseudonocardia eucalypti]|uniref:hypothetical protein n=1 Tax=Pseudonocardia eucalypti TaxID=648755 RepID=UPI0031ED92B8